MREFFFGHSDALDILGWHIALLLVFIAGIMTHRYWTHKHIALVPDDEPHKPRPRHNKY